MTLTRLLIFLFAAFAPDPYAATAWADGSPRRTQIALGNEDTTAAPPTTRREEGDRAYFTDRILVDQHGKPMRFYSDLLKDKTVLIQFMYTQCKEACPLTTKQLADTQKVLGGRMGKDIYFLSLSVDPEKDTPERLKDYGRRFGAGPGWLFLTGNKEDIEAVSHQLGQTSPVIEGHLPIFLLGNVRTGHWMKLQPYSAPSLIARQLLSLADEPS